MLSWRTVGDLQKHSVPRSSLPVFHFFCRCFFHLWDFVKNNTSETPERAAFPILWLNSGAQITHGGQVKRPREKVVITNVRNPYERLVAEQLSIKATVKKNCNRKDASTLSQAWPVYWLNNGSLSFHFTCFFINKKNLCAIKWALLCKLSCEHYC